MARASDGGPQTECWLKTTSIRAGYARKVTKVKGKPFVRAFHRFAWEQATGAPVPDGAYVLHTCDTKNCYRNDDVGVYVVNGVEYPRRGHLWLGDQSANMLDMYAKGRKDPGPSMAKARAARKWGR